MNRNVLCIALAVLFVSGFSLNACAQAKPEVLVKQRQAAMVLQGKYFGPLGAMAQGKVPYDPKLAQRNAAFLEPLTKMPWDGFDPSTKNQKSGALPAVFSDAAKFRAAQERLENDVAKLTSLAKTGDEAAVKTQIGAVAKACSNCHDSFREKR